MEKADALIVTSPVYSLQITGLLKNSIDHMAYNFHRPRFFTKKALVITTTAIAEL
ncbi:NAD(P)H-dependent oxidoreductase [Clostridium sporogenes]|uniref:NAD(P)H-dependent oxidoreductase n=1 Tax=Clostridium sporogenes TaxID=1509 RepID=UPI00325FABF3